MWDLSFTVQGKWVRWVGCNLSSCVSFCELGFIVFFPLLMRRFVVCRFHERCLVSWLASHGTCPLCRVPMNAVENWFLVLLCLLVLLFLSRIITLNAFSPSPCTFSGIYLHFTIILLDSMCISIHVVVCLVSSTLYQYTRFPFAVASVKALYDS